ncbi:hypothetical protein [Marivita sp.]|jgi:hypothetical protein|uniref:hypothetical protein n=2 Tax=Marivita sp. TaxID=2003365 RepID=UPI003B5B6617
MMANARLVDFIRLSVDLTGMSEYRIIGTGNAETFLDLAVDRCSEETIAAMLEAHGCVQSDTFERDMRHLILGDPRFGAIARNLLKLWYIGTWAPLPSDWYEVYGNSRENGPVIPSITAYTAGLLWPTIGGNPQGAKPLGYGMWAHPPKFVEN